MIRRGLTIMAASATLRFGLSASSRLVQRRNRPGQRRNCATLGR
jgi:hypothetical protein